MPDRAVILLCDDSEDDVLLIKRAFEKAGIPNPLYIVRDGNEAISYLLGAGKFSNRNEYPLPDLLLLDLKMPGTDGFEVLRWIKEQAWLAALRVLVLTSSDQVRDVNQAYQLGANSFLVKPTDFDNFVQISRDIQHYWLLHSKTPELHRPQEVRRSGSRSASKKT